MSNDESNKSAKDILTLLCKDEDIKQDLCTTKFIPTVGENDRIRSTKKIVQDLYNEIFLTGLKKMLECLHRNTIKDVFVPKVSFEDKIPTAKAVLIKRTHLEILKDPRKFFEDIDAKGLWTVMDDLEWDIPDSENDYVDTVMDEIEKMGLTNLFSSYPEKKLQDMADACNLKVKSGSKEILMDCLLAQENFKPPKKKVKQEKASKKKPKIKAGITKVDLQTHFYRDELYDYCRDHQLNTSGSKKDYISRILAHVEGREQPKINKKGAMLNKSKRKKRRTSSTDEEQPKKKKKTDKSEKSSKTEESEEEGRKGDTVESEQQQQKKSKKNKEDKKKEQKEEGSTTTTTTNKGQ